MGVDITVYVENSGVIVVSVKREFKNNANEKLGFEKKKKQYR